VWTTTHGKSRQRKHIVTMDLIQQWLIDRSLCETWRNQASKRKINRVVRTQMAVGCESMIDKSHCEKSIVCVICFSFIVSYLEAVLVVHSTERANLANLIRVETKGYYEWLNWIEPDDHQTIGFPRCFWKSHHTRVSWKQIRNGGKRRVAQL
jgi:hypothetical protein